MWPVGLSVEVAEQIRSDLRDMARARRIARCVVWLERALASNRRRQYGDVGTEQAKHKLRLRANKQGRLISRFHDRLVDVCHG
jgi:hypothetical protein